MNHQYWWRHHNSLAKFWIEEKQKIRSRLYLCKLLCWIHCEHMSALLVRFVLKFGKPIMRWSVIGFLASKMALKTAEDITKTPRRNLLKYRLPICVWSRGKDLSGLHWTAGKNLLTRPPFEDPYFLLSVPKWQKMNFVIFNTKHIIVYCNTL